MVRSAPNPFRNQVSLSVELPEAGDVRVEIYSVSGQRIARLSPGALPAGEHNLTWQVDGRVPGGVYFYKVFANGAASSGKMIRVD